jgi:hypothetical protein
MSDDDRMMSVLTDARAPLCDDCAAELGGWTRRQSANKAGRRLAARNEIARLIGVCSLCLKNKVVSSVGAGVTAAALDEEAPRRPRDFRLVAREIPAAPGRPEPMTHQPAAKPWHWEGNIQSAIVGYLATQGFDVRQVTMTSTKETGVDVIAEKDGRELWVTVKGYPQGTPKTHATTQSRHWFSHAIFDVVLYRSRSEQVDIAVGLPDGFTTYLTLASRVGWLKDDVPFAYLWVAKDGSVRAQ